MSITPSEMQVAAEAQTPEPGDAEQGPAAIQGRSLGQIAWRRLKHDKLSMAGGIVALLITLVAVFAKQITDLYGFSYAKPVTGLDNLISAETGMPKGNYGGATGTHWLGLVPLGGQDIFAQIIYGARTSMIIGVAATLLSLVLGVSTGLIAGYYRGWSDAVLARIYDILLAFPSLLFSIALVTVFSYVPSFLGMSGQLLRYVVLIFVLGFFSFPYIGRIVRGQVLSLREKEFVDSARSLGASNFRIMTKEILPNLVGPILVYATLSIPANILGEAGLSYLGVGVLPPTISWGSMLSDAQTYYTIDPTYLFAPGLAIFITVIAFNLFGDGLRDAFDPKSMR